MCKQSYLSKQPASTRNGISIHHVEQAGLFPTTVLWQVKVVSAMKTVNNHTYLNNPMPAQDTATAGNHRGLPLQHLIVPVSRLRVN